MVEFLVSTDTDTEKLKSILYMNSNHFCNLWNMNLISLPQWASYPWQQLVWQSAATFLIKHVWHSHALQPHI